MEFAIKSEDINTVTEIRPLSDAEIDCVEGGVYKLANAAAALVNLVISLTGGVH